MTKILPMRGSPGYYQDGPGDAMSMLIRMAEAKRAGSTLDATAWLRRHNDGDVSEDLADAQRALDRAAEGGFFDTWEGRKADATTRREMLDEANGFLGRPDVVVCLVDEDYVEEEAFEPPARGFRRVRKWRTRLVAVPK
jgi:hypothetical protein